MLTNPSFFATGNILPSIFVEISTRPFFVRAPLAANAKVYGISQAGVQGCPGTPYDDTYAANNNEPIGVWGPGSVTLLTLGSGGATSGQNLTNDITGYGVLATSGQNVGAIALDTGNSGEKIRVFVKNMGQTA